jgi:hypothetical protein
VAFALEIKRVFVATALDAGRRRSKYSVKLSVAEWEAKMPGIGGSIERVTDQDRLKGVRGWLLLPPVVAGLHILSLVLELMRLAIWGSEEGRSSLGGHRHNVGVVHPTWNVRHNETLART